MLTVFVTDVVSVLNTYKCEWNGQVGNINISSATKGAIFDIEIEYWAFSDIDIFGQKLNYKIRFQMLLLV